MISPERQWAEDIALALESMGMPRSWGKLLGWLLICDPSQQSSIQLAAALDLSAGSVSTGMRMLENAALVRRVAVPGSRAKVYEMTEDAFVLAARNEQFAAIRKLLDQGVTLLGDEESLRARRMRRSRDFYAFLEHEIPALVDRFMAEDRRLTGLAQVPAHEHGEGGNG
jgi:DNA-binding transcriptional regulator GbsR (MarR family)